MTSFIVVLAFVRLLLEFIVASHRTHKRYVNAEGIMYVSMYAHIYICTHVIFYRHA